MSNVKDAFLQISRKTSGRTECEDFNFTEIHPIVGQRKLDDDVSEAKFSDIHIITVDTDSCSSRYSARILTAQSVVPQNRWVSFRVVIS